MKKLIYVCLAGVLFQLMACDSGRDPNADSTLTASDLLGKWEVTYFFDLGDQSATYRNLTLDFGQNASIVATDLNGFVGGGTFAVFDAKIDGTPSIVVEMIFDDTEPLNELEEEWIVSDFDGEGRKIEFLERVGKTTPEVLHLTRQAN